MEIWKDAGIPSYTCAIGKQYLTYSKSLLNRALAVQNPKVVMIEGNSLFRPFDEQELVKTAVKDAFPIFERHDRWKALTPEDFVAAPENTWVDDMKGFRLKWGIRPADASKYMASDERVQEVPELTMTVLRQMADACHADGAQMVLIATPSTKNWSQARHNGMVKVAEELGIDWIDLNTGDDEVAIDWDTDTRDYGDHLNYYGATKASAQWRISCAIATACRIIAPTSAIPTITGIVPCAPTSARLRKPSISMRRAWHPLQRFARHLAPGGVGEANGGGWRDSLPSGTPFAARF